MADFCRLVDIIPKHFSKQTDIQNFEKVRHNFRDETLCIGSWTVCLEFGLEGRDINEEKIKKIMNVDRYKGVNSTGLKKRAWQIW